MSSDPLEARLREIKSAAAADAELASSVEAQIHGLIADFAKKMAARSTVPFLSREAASSGADPVVAEGWCIAGAYAEVRLPPRPAPVSLQPSGWYESTCYEGLGVCVDGTVVRLHLDSPTCGGMAAYVQDAYALSCATDAGTTCELLYSFGFGTDPAGAFERLTSALATTMYLHEGVEQFSSDRRAPEATSLFRRIERTREWGHWNSLVEAELSSVESSTERAIRLLQCLDGVEGPLPSPWIDAFQKLALPLDPPEDFDLMRSPPWDHACVLDWFLEAVSASPAEFTFRHYVEGGWIRGSDWKETAVWGWQLSGGATQRDGRTDSPNWRNIVVTVDGEIRGWRGEELAADVGFNARALQEMAELASLSPLPRPPDLKTVSYTDQYGHTSWQFADGADFFADVDLVRLGSGGGRD